MNQHELRKAATTAGSVVIVVGIVFFFFFNENTASMPFGARLVATIIGVVTAIIALRIYFAKFKF